MTLPLGWTAEVWALVPGAGRGDVVAGPADPPSVSCCSRSKAARAMHTLWRQREDGTDGTDPHPAARRAAAAKPSA